MATIKEIAKLSGYSIGTVSRVINNNPHVSPIARREISKIIEEMADVLIMMEQVIYLSGIDRKDIDDCIQYKLDRQMKRIKEEKNNG